jgi:hypothetical protein
MVSMGTMVITGIRFVDVCQPCYLTDHHNRDGECLLGVRVTKNGRKPDTSANMFMTEVNGADWGIPEDITDQDLHSAFLECIGDWRLDDQNAPHGRSQDILNAWFVVQWADVEADPDMYDPEREQQALAMELTLDAMAVHTEEWE